MAFNQRLMIIITVFILLLIGLNLVPTVVKEVDENTETAAAVNESITIASATGTTTFDDLTANPTYFSNASTEYTTLFSTEGLNITLATGVITSNGTVGDGTYNISYGYYPDDYIKSGSSRALIRLVKLFFVLALLGIAILVITKGGFMEDLQKLK